MNAQDFKAYYAQLTDGELAKIASSRRSLLPEARACLDEEIANRRLTPEDLKRFRNYRHDYRHDEDPVVRKMRRSKLLGKVNELSKMPQLRWQGILVVLVCSFILAFIFDHFGVFNRMRPVCGSILILVLTLKYHWELKRRPWFWLTVSAWALAHGWLIWRIRWPNGWVPAKVLEGYVTVDLVAIFVIIALIEKVLHEGPFEKRSRHANGSPSGEHG